MRWLRMMLTVLLAVVWIPLTAHCELERLTGLEALRCAHAETDGASGGSHCDGGLCCSWESGQYQLPQSQRLVVAPLFVVVPPILVIARSGLPTELKVGVRTAPRLRPPKPWQFSSRAALPVRAPSIAS